MLFNSSNILTQDLLQIDKNIFFGGADSRASALDPTEHSKEKLAEEETAGEDTVDEPGIQAVDNLGHLAFQSGIESADDHLEPQPPNEVEIQQNINMKSLREELQEAL